MIIKGCKLPSLPPSQLAVVVELALEVVALDLEVVMEEEDVEVVEALALVVPVVGEEGREGGLEEDGEVCLRGWEGSLWMRWRGSRGSWRYCMFVGRGGFEVGFGVWRLVVWWERGVR